MRRRRSKPSSSASQSCDHDSYPTEDEEQGEPKLRAVRVGGVSSDTTENMDGPPFDDEDFADSSTPLTENEIVFHRERYTETEGEEPFQAVVVEDGPGCD